MRKCKEHKHVPSEVPGDAILDSGAADVNVLFYFEKCLQVGNVAKGDKQTLLLQHCGGEGGSGRC